jgi:4-amino-4-deoxy-L-arabinose transferase-like glycosyltransferase
VRDARPLPLGLCLLLLILLCGLLYGYAIYRTPFRGLYDDVNRSLIARSMADSGRWVIPRFIGKPTYTKPPLMYWVAGTLYRLTGRRDELPATLASVLSSFLAVLATFWAGSVLFGRRSGLRAAVILATSFLFLMMARQPLIDTVMMAGFALAYAAVVQAAFAPGRLGLFWWLLAAVGVGLATLAKGPVILPVFLLILIGSWRRGTGAGRILGTALLGLLVFAAVVAPWYVVLLQRAPEAAAVLKVELLGRFSANNPFHDWTQKPWWFYGPDLVNFLPWLPLLPAGLVFALRRRRERSFRLLLWWAVGGFLFFSLASASKRSYYLLPIYPAFALLCGAVWNTARESSRRTLFESLQHTADDAGASARNIPPADYALEAPVQEEKEDDSGADWLPRRLVLWGALLVAVVVILAGLVTIVLPWRCTVPSRALFGVAGAGAVVMGTLAAHRMLNVRWRRAFSSLIIALCLVYLPFLGRVVTKLNNYYSGRMFWRTAAQVLDAEAVPPLLAVVRHDDRPFAAFYLDREDVEIVDVAAVASRTRDRQGGYVIANPQRLQDIAGLRPMLLQTLRAPCGRERQLGLFAIPGPADLLPPPGQAPAPAGEP